MAMLITGVAGELFGSIGAVTFSKVSSGQSVAKIKACPCNRLTERRTLRRSLQSQAIYNWSNVLSQANRDDWCDAADHFVQTRHGYSYKINGYNLYCAYYSMCYDIEEAPLSAPMVFSGRRPIPVVTPSWDAANHRIKCTTPATGNGDHYIIWRWSNADSYGKITQRMPYRHFDYDCTFNAVTRPLIAEYRGQNGTIYLQYNAFDLRGSYSSSGWMYLPYVYS